MGGVDYVKLIKQLCFILRNSGTQKSAQLAWLARIIGVKLGLCKKSAKLLAYLSVGMVVLYSVVLSRRKRTSTEQKKEKLGWGERWWRGSLLTSAHATAISNTSNWSKNRSLISREGALEPVGGNSPNLPLIHGCHFTRLPPSAHCMLRKILSQDGQTGWMRLPYCWGCNDVTQQYPCRLTSAGDQSPILLIMLSFRSVRLCPARQEISHIHDPCPKPFFSLTLPPVDKSLSIADTVLDCHPRITN